MDFGFTEAQELLRASVRRMLDRVATPEYVRAADVQARYPYELYDAFVEMGLIAMVFPEEYGGLGGNALDVAIISEELARLSAPQARTRAALPRVLMCVVLYVITTHLALMRAACELSFINVNPD